MAQLVEVVGANHKWASLPAREKLAAQGWGSELAKLVADRLGATEVVVLSTCNRYEIYYVTPARASHPDAPAILCELVGEPPVAGWLYHHDGDAAVRHLFEVACGLDSMILGECEVMAQVKAALRQSGGAGPRLSRLFHQALHVGKRARRETAISSGVFSLGHCAVELAGQALGSLEGRRVLLFGAGQVAKVTAEHLAAQGAGPISVFSRTAQHAQALAATLGGSVVTAEAIPAALLESDILVGCAAAPHHLLTAEQLEQACAGRAGRPLVIIDLGVPRNVDPAVCRLPGISLFNVDHLESLVAQNTEARQAEIGRVRAIIAEEIASFRRWEEATEVADVITGLQAQAEQIRQECLRLAERRGLPAGDLEQVEYVTDLLVRKLLHRPIVALKNGRARHPAVTDLAGLAGCLFGLAPDDSAPGAGGKTGTRPVPRGDQ